MPTARSSRAGGSERSSAPRPKRRRSHLLLGVVSGAAILLVTGMLLCWTFVADVMVVPTTSMLPTIHPGDLVLVDKMGFGGHGPKLGDVVIFENPEYKDIPAGTGNPLISAYRHEFAPVDRILIKRVIGLPGQVIEVTPHAVLVNGKVLREPWLHGRTAEGKTFGPYRVPPHEYFVMGDNRTHSIDSRYFPGHAVPRKLILGRAVMVIWPPSQIGGLG